MRRSPWDSPSRRRCLKSTVRRCINLLKSFYTLNEALTARVPTALRLKTHTVGARIAAECDGAGDDREESENGVESHSDLERLKVSEKRKRSLSVGRKKAC